MSRSPKSASLRRRSFSRPIGSSAIWWKNSLGRIWEEGHPNSGIKANWKYYLEEAEQPVEVEQKLGSLARPSAAHSNRRISRSSTPAWGAGISWCTPSRCSCRSTRSQGFSQRDAAQSIVENNLYGLDIDNRAAQLAYFAVMMKARQYDRRFLTRGNSTRTSSPFAESNGLDPHTVNYFVGRRRGAEKTIFRHWCMTCTMPKSTGSILRISPVNFFRPLCASCRGRKRGQL